MEDHLFFVFWQELEDEDMGENIDNFAVAAAAENLSIDLQRRLMLDKVKT
jgi:hypothetical protein